MFDVFGEMETAGEINAVARSLKEEGEKEQLEKLCQENGLDEEITELFWNGEIDFITDDLMAAVGKLDMEIKEAKEKDLAEGIADYLKVQAEKDANFARKIRKKRKTPAESYGSGQEGSRETQKRENMRISAAESRI